MFSRDVSGESNIAIIRHGDETPSPQGDIEAAIKPDDAHFADSHLVVADNTFCGEVLRTLYMHDVVALGKRHRCAHTSMARASATQQSIPTVATVERVKWTVKPPEYVIRPGKPGSC
ncbi:hypothetical protein PTKU46_82520 [Paraburkholderia terrae]